jgi:hypothetical protein
MKKIYLLLFSFLFTTFSLLHTTLTHAQLTFSVSETLANPDFRVLVGENVGFADIEIQFGTNVSFENFSVGITEFASKADFIITDRVNADFSVFASNEMSRPDLIVQVQEEMSFPDVAIEFRETGSADYLIYSEIGDVNNTQIVMSLLPVIHRITKYKYKRLGEILLENDAYVRNTGCDELAIFLRKHGKKQKTIAKKKLNSSWLQDVEAYEFKSIFYVLADIKEMSEDPGEPVFQIFKTDSSTWRRFLDTKNDSTYEERFRTLIYGSFCGCE